MAVDVYTALGFVTLGIILGIIGQGIRIIIGIKKQLDLHGSKSWEDWFEMRKLQTSLFIAFIVGGVSGSLTAIWLPDGRLTVGLLVALIAVGYSVTDFIEGFIGSQRKKFLIKQ